MLGCFVVFCWGWFWLSLEFVVVEVFWCGIKDLYLIVGDGCDGQGVVIGVVVVQLECVGDVGKFGILGQICCGQCIVFVCLYQCCDGGYIVIGQ